MSHSTPLPSGSVARHNGDWSGPVTFSGDPTVADLAHLLLTVVADLAQELIDDGRVLDAAEILRPAGGLLELAVALAEDAGRQAGPPCPRTTTRPAWCWLGCSTSKEIQRCPAPSPE